MKDRGSVIIFSTFLMLVLSSIAMFIAFIVFLSIKATANSASAITAYYAAESGLEYNLSQIKQARDQQTVSLNAIVPSSANITFSSNDASYTVSASNDQKTELTFDLPALATQQIDIFDYDSGDSLLNYDNGSLVLTWNADSSCLEPADLQLDVKQFSSADWSSLTNNDSTSDIYIFSCCSGTYSLQQYYSYRLKLRSLYCDLENVDVKVLTKDASGNTVEVAFPNYLIILSTGTAGRTEIKLQAQTLWQPPVSGLGEYVLFSEEQICKGDSC